MIFVVDINREDTAVHEANLKKIPVVALVDTNCNPENIDHLIPCNDDAIRAIKLMVGKMADAVLEGKDMRKEEEIEIKASSPEDKSIRSRVSQEEEIDDKDLLGKATLQKLAESKREAEEKAAAEAIKDAAEEAAAEKAQEDSIEEPAEESAEKSIKESTEETSTEEVQEDAADKSAKKAAKTSVEESIEKTAAEEALGDAVEEPAKKPSKKSTKKSTKKSPKKSVKESTEEAANTETPEDADSDDKTKKS